MSNINKIWGERRRILLTEQTEIDLLYLKKDTFCSTHTHEFKINRFVVVEGKVKIETELGNKVLTKNQSGTVYYPHKHRFIALEDSIMIELAFVTKGRIEPDDIIREVQGGRIINGEYLSIPELRGRGLLEL